MGRDTLQSYDTQAVRQTNERGLKKVDFQAGSLRIGKGRFALLALDWLKGRRLMISSTIKLEAELGHPWS